MQRDLTTGEIIKYIEVPIKSTGSNAKNSLSLNRAPGPPSESIWGSVSNFPFWPGGLDVTEELPNVESFNADGTYNTNLNNIVKTLDFRTINRCSWFKPRHGI